MPCSDYGRAATEVRIRLDKATRAACEMARVIRYQSENNHECSFLFDSLTTRTQKWIKAHEKMDRERLKQEKLERRRKKLKKRALKKLSKKEIEALGIRR